MVEPPRTHVQFRVVIFLFAFGVRFEYKLVLWVFAFLQVLYLYRRYFFSMATIVNTVLDIVNERVFPSAVHGYEVRFLKGVYNKESILFIYPICCFSTGIIHRTTQHLLTDCRYLCNYIIHIHM